MEDRNKVVRAWSDLRAEIVRTATIKEFEILSTRRLEPSLEDIFMKELSRRRS